MRRGNCNRLLATFLWHGDILSRATEIKSFRLTDGEFEFPERVIQYPVGIGQNDLHAIRKGVYGKKM